MQSTAALSPRLARLAGAAAFLAVAVSGWLLLALEDHTYGALALALSLGLAGMFVVMELRFVRALGRFQPLFPVGEHGGTAEQALELLVDPETILPRLWVFLLRLKEEMQRAQRYGRPLTLCALEPDDFAAYLDQTFRRKVGRAVRGYLRTTDFATVDHAGRLLILLTETTSPGAEAAAKRLAKTLNSLLFTEKPCRWRGTSVVYPQDGMSPDDLLQTIDRVLAERHAA
jgi:GGDEF domain-containing protein